MATKPKTKPIEVKHVPFEPVKVRDPTCKTPRIHRVHCLQELEFYLARGWVRHG